MYEISDEISRKLLKTGKGIDSKRKTLCWGGNVERYLPGGFVIAITINDIDDAT